MSDLDMLHSLLNGVMEKMVAYQKSRVDAELKKKADEEKKAEKEGREVCCRAWDRNVLDGKTKLLFFVLRIAYLV